MYQLRIEQFYKKILFHVTCLFLYYLKFDDYRAYRKRPVAWIVLMERMNLSRREPEMPLKSVALSYILINLEYNQMFARPFQLLQNMYWICFKEMLCNKLHTIHCCIGLECFIKYSQADANICYLRNLRSRLSIAISQTKHRSQD